MGWDLSTRVGSRVSRYTRGQNSVKTPAGIVVAILCSGLLAWYGWMDWQVCISTILEVMPFICAWFTIKKTQKLILKQGQDLEQNTAVTVEGRDEARVAREATVAALQTMKEFDEKYESELVAVKAEIARLKKAKEPEKRSEKPPEAREVIARPGRIVEEDLP